MATLQAARAEIKPDEAPQLRVLTCGSVDDGKSTLLGRLLVDTDAVLDDQLAALETESRRWGTAGDGRDYALLLDGLSAEREQGITIDVAYRYFSTPRRSFILADTPGHEQYTRNMATGASGADLAIILVDARKGVLPQTRRHAFIAATLGIRHAVLAVNKMDLVGCDESRFQAIVATFAAAAAPLGFASIVPIPLVARDGDNIASRSERLGWHTGPTLLEHLETVEVTDPAAEDAPFRFPVQLVRRPDADFRGYAGTIASGTVRPGDAVIALPKNRPATIARIVTAGGDRLEAGPGDAVTLTLDREIDLARGDVLASAGTASDRLHATLLWMGDANLDPARQYIFQLGPTLAQASLSRVDHAIDIETYAPRPAATLGLNEIGVVELSLDRPVLAAPFVEARALGSFILIDRTDNATVAMGVVRRPPETAAVERPRRDWRDALPAVAAFAPIAIIAAIGSGSLPLAATLGVANMLLYPLINRLTPTAR